MLIAAVHFASAMACDGRGAVLITGGMPRPEARYTSLSLGKAGARVLTELLFEEYRPHGIHIVTVAVDCRMVCGALLGAASAAV
ncbi:hypothetical protein ACFTXM_45670 [Streptomyces sp. NPDC056930]|uniref:hypothetical protein n=1 Tax=Streptomyces sp. NPDC056930 TaxID=3345967 RepID=UPI003636DE8A